MTQAHSSTPVREQLLTAINEKYRTNLKVEDVDFQVVQDQPTMSLDVVDVDAGTEHNTKVKISNSVGQPYEFTTLLLFNRLSLSLLFEGFDKKFLGDITHTHQLVPLLRERLQLPIEEEDIAGHEIEGSVGYPKTVLLNAAFNSLLLHGSVELTLAGP